VTTPISTPNRIIALDTPAAVAAHEPELENDYGRTGYVVLQRAGLVYATNNTACGYARLVHDCVNRRALLDGTDLTALTP